MARPKKATKPVAGIPTTNEPQIDQQMRTLAILHRDKYAKLKAAKSKINQDLRELGKTIKEDGLTVRQIRLMLELSTPEGEAAFRMSVASDLIAAQFQGAAIGSQLALFLDPDKVTAVSGSVNDAYDLGVDECAKGKTARSPYLTSPETQSYLKGYTDEQERRVKAGITKLEPAKGYIPMTAEEFQNQQAEAKKAQAMDKPAGNA